MRSIVALSTPISKSFGTTTLHHEQISVRIVGLPLAQEIGAEHRHIDGPILAEQDPPGVARLQQLHQVGQPLLQRQGALPVAEIEVIKPEPGTAIHNAGQVVERSSLSSEWPIYTREASTPSASSTSSCRSPTRSGA